MSKPRTTATGLLTFLFLASASSRADTVQLSDDTNINLATPSQNNGTTASVFVRNLGAGGERHGFVRFDLTCLPSGPSVMKATLRLWVGVVNDPGTIDVAVVQGAWDEESLTAAIAPALDLPFASVAVTAADSDSFVSVDVTSAVQDWLDGFVANDGLALLPSTLQPLRVTLDSKENTGTGHPIELEVILTGGPATDLVAGASVVSDAEVDNNLTIHGGSVNNSPIGQSGPAAGTFTSLAATTSISVPADAITDTMVSDTLTASSVPAGGITGTIIDSQVSDTLTASALVGGTYGAELTFDNAANRFRGDGSELTNLNADMVDGFHASSVPAPQTLLALDGDGKLPASITGDARTLDGHDSMAFQKKYANVVVVAKSGGDFTTIQSALDSIVNAGANNRYLLWVAPGTYSETVMMKPYVDVEGAGELATTITSGGNMAVTLEGASHAELRSVTVIHTGGSTVSMAIRNSASFFRLTGVTASASGATLANVGVENAGSSSVVMSALTVTASGGDSATAVANHVSSPRMTDVTATASGGTSSNIGVHNGDGSPEMTNVIASALGLSLPLAVSRGIENGNASPRMRNVIAFASGGNDTIGVVNSVSSPTMTNVIASGTGGIHLNIGVYNGGSAPVMTNVKASASGGSIARGVYNSESLPAMTNVTATASGGSTASGVYNSESSTTIDNSVISASGATASNYGIENFANIGTYEVKVNNSQIRVTGTSTNTISNDSEFSTYVGASLLDGGAMTGGGSVKCAGVYDEAYTFHASDCPD